MSDLGEVKNFVDSIAPYAMGGAGAGFSLFLKYLTDRERRKIAEAEKNLEEMGRLEDLCRHQRDALFAIFNLCENIEVLGSSFQTVDSANKIIAMKTTLDRIKLACEDIFDDGRFQSFLQIDIRNAREQQRKP